MFRIDYDSAKKVIKKLKEKFGGSNLFGREKDQSFRGTIGAIYQTFGKKEVYPSIEEKAAHLLYFTIKNHSFVDGNKRIAAALFLWFLEMNNYLYGKNGRKRIADNALVALCLLIAESNPKEKDVIVKVVVNLINKLN
ncbi:MAG: Fic family protein [Ignavibacterium sp.]